MSERVPDGWVLTKLKHVLSTPSKKKVDNPQNIELLTVKLHGKGIVKSGKYPKPTTKGRPYYRRFEGELLIGRQNLHNGGLGLVNKSQAGLIASNAISSFLSKDNADMRYLHQALSSDWFQNYVDNLSSGTGQKETSETQILEILIPLPTLSEQKKIASILTSVDEVIENIQKQIDKLQDLKKATMNELLTKGIGHTEFKDSELGRIPKSWEVKSIEQLVNSERPVTYGIVQAGPHVESGVPYIRVSDMKSNRLQSKDMLRTSNEIASKFARSRVQEGDIVYALRGDIGKVLIVPKNLEGANLTQGTALISKSDNIDTGFLIWCFNGEEIQKQTKDLAKGSTFAEMTLGNLKRLKTVLPPIEEQVEIASILNACERSIDKKTLKLLQTQALKKSLMQDLLTGKVRVQVN